ncbi:vanin-like protein 1 [Stomoxys calcitrans]|uniref:vanin-like protein 1 n=1 Tax=Stomoxys calcitrans TaxID=35570 RepID=UPI0027E252D4|nr:vanin-like protein 1 [Stomoxys calcitrans]
MYKIPAVFFGLCALFFELSTQASLPSDLYYNAGVVEFRPSAAMTSESRLNDNLAGYLEILASKEAESLDIIVFPESTLNNNDDMTFVPNPSKVKVIPCDAEEGEDYHNVLKQLSCAARKYAKYLVINLTEKELCSEVLEDPRPCASNGLNIFNTNVVFDRQGTVISRYRKVHLYGENKNFTYVPEFGWFETDFGVRFGHFICFDILFYSPAQEMVDKHGIKDFIFTTMWFSQLPFLTAVQIQQAWSYGNDVNLLAAGASNPVAGSTGTGIYNGRNGTLVAVMNQGLGKRTLYVSRVPKYPHQKHRARRSLPSAPTTRLEKPDIFLKRDYLQFYDTISVDLSKGTHLSQKLCNSNSSLCCSFDLHWQPLSLNEDSQHYHYRLGAFRGIRNEAAVEKNKLMNCALISCIGKEDIMDCGKVHSINTDVIFENITIEATFPKANGFLLMPNSLKASDLMPVAVGEFEWSEVVRNDNQIDVRYSLNTSTSNLLAFSIYGNYYDGYGLGDGASSMVMSTLCGLIVVLVHLYL